MRKAINENPKVQVGLIAVLILAGFVMFKKMNSSSEPDPGAAAVGASGAGIETGTATPAPAIGDPAAAAATASSTPAPTPAATATAATSTPTTSGTVSPEALIPGPGLPRDVVKAFARGDAVVLLFVKQGSVDDDKVRSSVSALSGKPGVSVFVAPAGKIARYSRITQAVGVNRVPALVVIRPRRVSGATPEAVVSYGFRGPKSVLQAVDDALYEGRDDVPYHPG